MTRWRKNPILYSNSPPLLLPSLPSLSLPPLSRVSRLSPHIADEVMHALEEGLILLWFRWQAGRQVCNAQL